MNSERPLSAWLLPIAPDTYVAVGQYELKHIEQIDSPQEAERMIQSGLLHWGEQPIPLVDFGINRQSAISGASLVAIVAFRRGQHGALQIGAIALQSVPELIAVDANQAEAIDSADSGWIGEKAHAAFVMDNRFYPVLDLPEVFAPGANG